MKDRIDDLQIGGLKLYQNDELYAFTSDAVLLANFDKIKKDAVVVDFGTGSGVIAILIAYKSKAKMVYGIEIQKVMSDMASRSVALNGLEERVKIINDSIQNAHNIIGRGQADVVVCNPPYSKVGTCKVNENENAKISRHEVLVTLDEIFESASRVLKSKGEFRMVHQATRLGEIIVCASKYNFALKKMRLVQSFAHDTPHLVLIKFVKDGGLGVEVLPNLIMNNLDGTYTDEVREIYNKETL